MIRTITLLAVLVLSIPAYAANYAWTVPIPEPTSLDPAGDVTTLVDEIRQTTADIHVQLAEMRRNIDRLKRQSVPINQPVQQPQPPMTYGYQPTYQCINGQCYPQPTYYYRRR